MKATKFFMACMMASLLCVNISAQNPTQNDKTRKQQKPTPEEMVTKHTENMQQRLLLDEATAAKFAPIYKEYLTNLQQCKACTDKKSKELTDAERTERIENGFATQKKIIETKETYYKKLKKILNARQLEIVFSSPKHHMQRDRKQPNAPMQMCPLSHAGNQGSHHQAPQAK